MLIPLSLLTLVTISSGLVVRHSNGSLVEFEKEEVGEQISSDLIVGSYSSLPESGKAELHVSAGDEADQYR